MAQRTFDGSISRVSKSGGIETWLGLLILGIVVGLWFKAPPWLTDAFGFLFSATLVVLIAAGAYAWALSRVAGLRGVHFENDRIQGGLPWRLRWLGRNLFFGARRYRAKVRRKGALMAWCRYRGCQLLALAALAAGLIAAVCGLYVENKWASIGLVLGGPSAGVSAMWKLVYLSRRLGRERLKYLAAPAREALAQDLRRPVVWLRSFQIDERDTENIIDRDVPLTFEEVATGPLSRYGPVVAIGRPGEPLPPLGALREYVGDNWQSRVRELLSLAAIIVIVVDDTPGLLWELKTVVDSKLHERLILLMPPDEAAPPDGKRTALAEALGKEISFAASQNSDASKDKLLAVVFRSDLVPERIIAAEHWAEYYHDAVELGAWFVTTGAQRAAPVRTS